MQAITITLQLTDHGKCHLDRKILNEKVLPKFSNDLFPEAQAPTTSNTIFPTSNRECLIEFIHGDCVSWERDRQHGIYCLLLKNEKSQTQIYKDSKINVYMKQTEQTINYELYYYFISEYFETSSMWFKCTSRNQVEMEEDMKLECFEIPLSGIDYINKTKKYKIRLVMINNIKQTEQDKTTKPMNFTNSECVEEQQECVMDFENLNSVFSCFEFPFKASVGTHAFECIKEKRNAFCMKLECIDVKHKELESDLRKTSYKTSNKMNEPKKERLVVRIEKQEKAKKRYQPKKTKEISVNETIASMLGTSAPSLVVNKEPAVG